jgi:hypothetical protein
MTMPRVTLTIRARSGLCQSRPRQPTAAGNELQGIARSLTHVLPIILGGLALQSRRKPTLD